jgi:hypothetical protein
VSVVVTTVTPCFTWAFSADLDDRPADRRQGRLTVGAQIGTRHRFPVEVANRVIGAVAEYGVDVAQGEPTVTAMAAHLCAASHPVDY